MSLAEFTTLRRDELLSFFQARFGKHWRQTVERQVGLHPRAFQRWTGAKPMSLYRQIHRLESWARSVGFQSSTDDKVQAALQRHQAFREAAAQEVAKAKAERKASAAPAEGMGEHQLLEAGTDALNRRSERE